MPFPLAHPAAVLPLRRWFPTLLTLSALVVGSLTPDSAYILDHFDKFSHSHLLVGPLAPDLAYWGYNYDWDDFAHTAIGSVLYCLPVGFVILWIFRSLRAPLTALLPNPHRDALLPLCRGCRVSWTGQALALFVGIWTHILWDNLTNADRWLSRHVPFLHEPLFHFGSTPFSVCRVFWILSSVGGIVILGCVYHRWIRRKRSDLDPSASKDSTAFIRCAVILLIPLIPAVPVSCHHLGHHWNLQHIYHAFHDLSQYYLAGLAGLLVPVGLYLKVKARVSAADSLQHGRDEVNR